MITYSLNQRNIFNAQKKTLTEKPFWANQKRRPASSSKVTVLKGLKHIVKLFIQKKTDFSAIRGTKRPLIVLRVSCNYLRAKIWRKVSDEMDVFARVKFNFHDDISAAINKLLMPYNWTCDRVSYHIIKDVALRVLSMTLTKENAENSTHNFFR